MSEVVQQLLVAGARREIALPGGGGVSMAFRHIPAGEFRMGQRGGYAWEEPVHRVVIPEGFWMGETPVTQAQFAAWKPEYENGFPGKSDHPAERVTWDEGREFCDWLTEILAEDGWADLPDEARWEYACRAGTDTEYHSGDGEAALAEVGWFDGNSGNETHPVGGKEANAWGLFDMHGNVWEWCADAWDAGAYRKRLDGWDAQEFTTTEVSPGRVVRGGSWDDSARVCRSAGRFRRWPTYRDSRRGFRVCLARSSPAQSASQQETGKAEPGDGGGGRRDAAAKPEDQGGAGDGMRIDLANETLPKRSA